MPPLVLGLLAGIVASAGRPPNPQADSLVQEPASCKPCHEAIVNSFVRTAHFHTSARASAQSVQGDYTRGHNRLRTRSAGVYFTMDRRNGAFYQTGVDSLQARARTERIDLVVGSGRRGQTYLYWKNGLLFELPVSYLAGPKQWINSPGYADGAIDFGRVILPRCLECHSTSFTLTRDRGAVTYSGAYELGVSCAKCHGDGRRHVQYHSSYPAEGRGKYILNPARFPRARKLDNCALCHSGLREPSRPSFSYRPGERLDEYFLPPSDLDAIPDVHGNQVGLLQGSKCFRSSTTLSCSTCHDVHRPQRDVAQFAKQCLACHQTSRHPMAAAIGARMMTSCIDCHMPTQRSNALQINTPTQQFSLDFRSHAIGIYREVAARILEPSKQK
ncbi:MAG TPA: cytochrome c3 family protein [Gemmatimonadales bacterium]|nr:cytochrome c3 family protein [Gemmatimonadales bacterium]